MDIRNPSCIKTGRTWVHPVFTAKTCSRGYLLAVQPAVKALEVLRARKTKVQSWYLDLTMVEKYWGKERTYHHTAPISMNYALYEGLKLIVEEGLEARFERHRRNPERRDRAHGRSSCRFHAAPCRAGGASRLIG